MPGGPACRLAGATTHPALSPTPARSHPHRLRTERPPTARRSASPHEEALLLRRSLHRPRPGHRPLLPGADQGQRLHRTDSAGRGPHPPAHPRHVGLPDHHCPGEDPAPDPRPVLLRVLLDLPRRTHPHHRPHDRPTAPLPCSARTPAPRSPESPTWATSSSPSHWSSSSSACTTACASTSQARHGPRPMSRLRFPLSTGQLDDGWSRREQSQVVSGKSNMSKRYTRPSSSGTRSPWCCPRRRRSPRSRGIWA